MARPPMLFGKPKPKTDLGAPSGFGGPPPPAVKRAPRAAAPPTADPDQDQDIDTGGPDLDTDQDQGDASGPTVTPEAVSFRTAAQQCNSCEYMGQDGNCAVLKMPVEANDGCNAHKDGSGGEEAGMETRGHLRGSYGGGSQSTDDGY